MSTNENGMNNRNKFMVQRKYFLKFFNPLSEFKGSLQCAAIIAPFKNKDTTLNFLSEKWGSFQVSGFAVLILWMIMLGFGS
jgi:hypothetical protein